MLRLKMPDIEGSPGAPQSSTTFHQVIPIIGFNENQIRYMLRRMAAWIISPCNPSPGDVIVISDR